MKRMLVLTPRFPYPLHGGDLLRIYRVCEALSRDWSLTLASICQSNEEMAQELPPDSPFAEVHKVHLPPLQSKLNALRALVGGECLQVAYYASSRFQALVDRLAPSHDAVLCHLLRTAPYAQGFPGARLLELTDHLPLTYRRSNDLARGSLSLRRLAYRVEEQRADRAQNQLAKDFDLVTFVSDLDREMFLRSSGLAPNRVATFSNGVALHERPFTPAREGRRIAFIGNLKAMPNADAVAHFVEDILPLLARQAAPVQFKVIGPCPDAVRASLQRPGVEFTGPVESIAEAVADCAIGVCPVRVGAGVQNKMLDYMALGLTAVTSSLGAEGIDGKPGTHFLRADGAEAFAASVQALLDDFDLRQRLALAGRRLMEDTYSWDARLANLSAYFRQVARWRDDR